MDPPPKKKNLNANIYSTRSLLVTIFVLFAYSLLFHAIFLFLFLLLISSSFLSHFPNFPLYMYPYIAGEWRQLVMQQPI
jgi:hypothetical protein